MTEPPGPQIRNPNSEIRELPPRRAPLLRDDIAYMLPMLVFLAFTWLGANWRHEHPWTYPASYLAKTFIVAALLVYLWPRFTKIRWSSWWLGAIVGVVGIFQWIGMQLALQHQFPNLFAPSKDVFTPADLFTTPASFWSFVAVRMTGAVLVVPVMEELFWRDYLWRQILAPNDFKLAEVGEFGWAPFLIVPAVFALVHGNWWLDRKSTRLNSSHI